MTGFGRATARGGDADITIDVSSVNRKGLEVACSLPRDWQPIESEMAKLAKKYFSRGKVSISCRISLKDGSVNFSLDEDALFSALTQLKIASQKLEVEFKPTTELLLKINEYCSQSVEPDLDAYKGEVLGALEEALRRNDSMRLAEGETLKRDLGERMSLLGGMLDEIEERSKGSVQNYRDCLMRRLSSLNLEMDMEDERLLKEVAIFADKCDISEEITRLRSHISQFQATIDFDDAIGRKLDFLCQEMGREINTISSKANNLSLTKTALEFKNELERVREQVQNVE